jgi:hypothetical protein
MSTKTRTYRKFKKCLFCGNRKNLNIHHIRYKTKNGKSILFKESKGDLVVLCKNCHNEWHKINGDKIFDKYTYILLGQYYKKYKNIALSWSHMKNDNKIKEIKVIEKSIIEKKITPTYTLKKVNGKWDVVYL